MYNILPRIGKNKLLTEEGYILKNLIIYRHTNKRQRDIARCNIQKMRLLYPKK